VTTNLLTLENASSKTKTKTRPYKKRLYNPIDYTHVRKEEWEDNEVAVRPPWSPLSSNLPIPKKIILKITTEDAVKNKTILLSALMILNSITGIHAVPVFAQVGDASKGIREGMPIGAMVELSGMISNYNETGASMFEFLDKLAMTVLPRIRDWEGFEGVGDDNGGLALRIPQNAVGYFPDIEPHFDSYPLFFDIDVLIHTTGKSDWETALCISGFQIPFKLKRIIKAEEEKEDNDPWAKFRKPKTKEERKAQAKQRAQDAAKTN
jgi:large subunit ribosomal protein L5